VVGLINNNDETNYRNEVCQLARWCSENNLCLNVEKTKEIVVDFRRVHTQHPSLTINGAVVVRVSSTKFGLKFLQGRGRGGERGYLRGRGVFKVLIVLVNVVLSCVFFVKD